MNITHESEARRPPREGKATNLSWFRGLKRSRESVSEGEFAHLATVPKVTRDGFTGTAPTRPRPKTGWILAGEGEELAPRLVNSQGRPELGKVEILTVHTTKAARAMGAPTVVTVVRDIPAVEMADFGAATDRRNQQLKAYRAMTPEDRAEWLYGAENAPYDPSVKLGPWDACKFARRRDLTKPPQGPGDWVPVY